MLTRISDRHDGTGKRTPGVDFIDFIMRGGRMA
jgi:hypothetical protein